MLCVIEYLTHCSNGHHTDNGDSSITSVLSDSQRHLVSVYHTPFTLPKHDYLSHKNYHHFCAHSQIQISIHNFL